MSGVAGCLLRVSGGSLRVYGGSHRVYGGSIGVSGRSLRASGRSLRASGRLLKTLGCSLRLSAALPKIVGCSLRVSARSIKVAGQLLETQRSLRRRDSPSIGIRFPRKPLGPAHRADVGAFAGFQATHSIALLIHVHPIQAAAFRLGNVASPLIATDGAAGQLTLSVLFEDSVAGGSLEQGLSDMYLGPIEVEGITSPFANHGVGLDAIEARMDVVDVQILHQQRRVLGDDSGHPGIPDLQSSGGQVGAFIQKYAPAEVPLGAQVDVRDRGVAHLDGAVV